MRFSVPLVRVLGIPIRLNFSWFLTFGFVTLVLALEVFPSSLPDSSPRVHWALGLASGLLFFASIVVHELAHSFVARAYGIPVKGITLFIFGGVAQIAREATRPLVEFVMAIAGPLTSVLLAGIFFSLWLLSDSASGSPLHVMWEWLWLMNIVVGIFNMAPGFPMDGGRVLRSIIWGLTGNFRRSTFIASWCGRGIAYLMIGTGMAGAFGVLEWISPASSFLFVLMGFFLEGAARQSWQQLRLLDFLRGFRADELMARNLPTVDVRLTLRDAVPGGVDLRRVCLLAVESERVVGIVTEAELRAVKAQDWNTTTVAQAMLPADNIRTASLTTDLTSVLQAMEEESTRFTPIVEDGRVLGVVARESIIRLLMSHKLLS